MNRLARHLALWCIVVLFLSACGGGGDSTASSDAGVTAFGKAHLSGGLANATVELQSRDGRPAQQLNATTRNNGVFVLTIPPTDTSAFRLVFSGGSHAGTAFTDSLVVDVENFNVQRDLLYANAVTTLAARYRDRHPNTSVAEANNRVKRFLDIPSASNVGLDVANPKQTYFAHSELLAKAHAAGMPLAAYLNGLVDDMDRGVPKRTFVLSASSFVKPDLDEIKDFFKKAGKGLLEHLGDELFSWAFESILTALGISSQAELLEQLHEINAKLDELTNLVNEVLSETKQIEAEIVSVALLAAVSDIKSQYDYLTWAAEYAQLACLVDPKTREPVDASCAAAQLAEQRGVQQTIRERVKGILDSNSGIIHQVELLRTALVTSGNERGVLLRANDYLRSTKPFYGEAPYSELVTIGTFYQSVQLVATNLIVEAYMAQEAPDRASARYYAQRHQNAVTEQEKLIGEQHWPMGTILDNRSKLTWQQAPWSHFNPIDGTNRERYYDHSLTAERLCTQAGEAFSGQGLGGFTKWRLPTDPELHEVVKGSPNPTGNADGGSGIFSWLRDHGFAYSDRQGYFEPSFVMGNAYLSSTVSGTTGWYREALWDYGVNNVYVFGSIGGENKVGVWCVTDESKTAGGE